MECGSGLCGGPVLSAPTCQSPQTLDDSGSHVPEPSAVRAHSVPVEHHPPLEEYLQTIESLTEEGVPVIQARIAERLGKSAPSVSEMVDRLIADGYVNR